MNEKYFWIYGKHSVLAALANPKRKVKKIFVTDLNNINYSNKSIIHLVEPKKISKLFYPQQASHQNIAAEPSPAEDKTFVIAAVKVVLP